MRVHDREQAMEFLRDWLAERDLPAGSYFSYIGPDHQPVLRDALTGEPRTWE